MHDVDRCELYMSLGIRPQYNARATVRMDGGKKGRHQQRKVLSN